MLTEKLCTNKEHLVVLPISAFNKKGKGHQSWCRECMKENSKKHYQLNPEYYATKRDSWRDKKLATLNEKLNTHVSNKEIHR
jgi:hypothetical protein